MNRHFIISALLILLSLSSFGQGYQVQSKYFVYLQTEPAQAFYIKINGQKITANTSGYLILPQLKDGDYKLVVGFPDSQIQEQVFNFRIDSKDKGYLIKDYGAEGWGLFDLQSMVVQKALTGAEAETTQTAKNTTVPRQETPVKKETIPDENVSDFTKILSQAAKDPSLLEKPKEEPKIEEPVQEETAIADQQPTLNNTTPTTSQQTPMVEDKPTNQQPYNQTDPSVQGVTLVYDDRNEFGQVDPITIFIPAPKASVNESLPPAEPQVSQEQTQNTSVPIVVNESKNDNAAFKVEEKEPITQKVEQPAKNVVAAPTNSACKSVAGEDDFLKLRRTMAAETNDDNMIAQAQKAFKAKCYTTSQVKYLSSMFLSNAGKYNFYAAAYPHVADRENFASLASEIKDQGYKEKFNSMLQ